MSTKMIYAIIMAVLLISALLCAGMYPYARLQAENSSREALLAILTSSGVSHQASYIVVESLINNISDPIEREKTEKWMSEYTFRVSKALTGKGMDPRQALAALGDVVPRLVSPRERNHVMNLGMSMARKGLYPGAALKAIGKILPILAGTSERDIVFGIGINLAREGVDPTGVLEAFRIAFPHLATSEQRIRFAVEAAGYMLNISRALKEKGLDPEYAVKAMGRILPGITSTQERILLTQELVSYFVNMPAELSKRKNAMKMLTKILPELKTAEEREQVIALSVMLSGRGINPAPAINALQGVLRYYAEMNERGRVIRLGIILAESGVNPANTYDTLFIQLESSEPYEKRELLDLCLAIAGKGCDPTEELRSIVIRRR